MVSAILTGILGVLYGHSLGYITTDSVYRDDTNLNLIVYSLLGGMGTLFGPVIGAFLLVFIPGDPGPDARFPSLRHRPAARLPRARRTGGIIGLVRNWRLRRRPGTARSQPNERRADPAGSSACPRAFRGLAAISDVRSPSRRLDHQHHRPNGAGKSTLFNLVTGYLKSQPPAR